MIEPISHQLIVEKLYEILASLNHQIKEQQTKHQKETSVLLRRLEQKDIEIAQLKFAAELSKSCNFSKQQKEEKRNFPISTVISNKKPYHEKQSLHLKIIQKQSKFQSKKISGVEMINSSQCKQSKEKTQLKPNNIMKLTSRRKSQDLTKFTDQKSKCQIVDKKSYIVKKKVDVQNKQNYTAPNLVSSISYKSPSNKHFRSDSKEEGQKQGLKLRDHKESSNRVPLSKQKQETILKSKSRKQISVYIPLKKGFSHKKSIDSKE